MRTENLERTQIGGRLAKWHRLSALAGAVVLVSASTAWPLAVPFTENFATDAANWRMSDSTTPLTWQSNGGPADSSHASTPFNFQNTGVSSVSGPAIFRGQNGFNSSGGAFVGNWVSGGVSTFTAYVLQNTGVAQDFFVRFATPANSPGIIGHPAGAVPSGIWTQISVPIAFGTAYTYEGAPSLTFFNTVFGNIGNVQLGLVVSAGSGLAGLNQSFGFGVDQISIVPEPTAGLLLIGGLVLLGSPRSLRGQGRAAVIRVD